MKSYQKKVILFVVLAAILISLVVSLFFFNPEELVEKIGTRNSYFALFVISFFGGFSAGGTVPFIVTLTTLAAAGLNPLYLGIVAGVALSVGDLVMSLVAFSGRDLIKGKLNKRLEKLSNFLNKLGKGFIPVTAYLYIGFTPFPNDLMVLSLAAINYPRKKVWLLIILGDLSFTISVAYLASKGIGLFF